MQTHAGLLYRLRIGISAIQAVTSPTVGQITFADLSVFQEFDPHSTGGRLQFISLYQLFIGIEILLEVQTKQSVFDPENWQADKSMF